MNKKTLIVATAISFLLVSLVEIQLVEIANAYPSAYPEPEANIIYYNINVVSPQNGAPAHENLTLKFTVRTNEPPRPSSLSLSSLRFGYTVDLSFAGLGHRIFTVFAGPQRRPLTHRFRAKPLTSAPPNCLLWNQGNTT